MKFRFSALALMMSTMPFMSPAQDRLTDKVVVNLPNDVTMNEQVIPAGKYEIRQLTNPAGGANVLFVTEEGAEKFHAAVTTIPALNNNTPDETRVILRRVGRTFYLEKIWIAGRDYGYEFELPGYAKLLMERKNEPATLRLDYKPASTTAAVSLNEPTRAPAQVSVAPVVPPEPAKQQPPVEISQAAPPPSPAPTAEPQAAPAPQPAPIQAQQAPPPAQTQPLPPALPATASPLFGVLLFGLASLAGSAALRWWRLAA